MRISVSDDGGIILSIDVKVCDEKHRTQNNRIIYVLLGNQTNNKYD